MLSLAHASQRVGNAILYMLLALPLLVSLGCCPCQYNPYAHLFTTEKPARRDVIGTYALKEQRMTRDGVTTVPGKEPLIELRQDGVFSATDFPTWKPKGAWYEADSFLTLRGRWMIDTVGGVSRGGSDYRSVWGITFDCRTTELEPASLTGTKPPYGLIFTYGDPDTGTVMIFEKVE